jgi:hypothetical protein
MALPPFREKQDDRQVMFTDNTNRSIIGALSLITHYFFIGVSWNGEKHRLDTDD